LFLKVDNWPISRAFGWPPTLIDERNLFCGKIVAISGHPVFLARDPVSHDTDRCFCSIDAESTYMDEGIVKDNAIR
jgi:hypothetical protein